MLTTQGKFNVLKTIVLIKNRQVFLLYHARLSKFKALQTQILR